jgi:hypothetical protein
MYSTTERSLDGEVLVIFLFKARGGNTLLDCRAVGEMLPKRSRVVALAQLIPLIGELQITWIPYEGWAPCGHMPQLDEGQHQCCCSPIYRLVNSKPDQQVKEFDWRAAVRSLAKERFLAFEEAAWFAYFMS